MLYYWGGENLSTKKKYFENKKATLLRCITEAKRNFNLDCKEDSQHSFYNLCYQLGFKEEKMRGKKPKQHIRDVKILILLVVAWVRL